MLDIGFEQKGNVANKLEPFTEELNLQLLEAFEGVSTLIKKFGNCYSVRNHFCPVIE